MTTTLFDVPTVGLDPDVVRVLDLLWSDPENADERALIVSGIYAVARAHHGVVDPNALREWLHDRDREPWLTKPQLVGAVVSALARAGTIRPAGWTVSTDRRGGNAGKPCRVWRLAGDPR
jgi:hypothetical protein